LADEYADDAEDSAAAAREAADNAEASADAAQAVLTAINQALAGNLQSPGWPSRSRRSAARCQASRAASGSPALQCVSPSALRVPALRYELSSNLARDTATTEAVEGDNPGAAVNWYLSAYNICWAP
jgi:hypothetical protein